MPTIPAVPDDDDEPTESFSKLPSASDDEQLNGEDLFGSDEDEDAAPSAKRTLDDRNLDFGDDLDRDDRAADSSSGSPAQQEEVELRRAPAEIATHPLPPSTADKELYLLKIPKFLGLEPSAFDRSTFVPPTTDHHSNEKSADFSAYKTAMKTMRWRRSPNNSANLESNARILRWSDGSLTLQLATDPKVQYQIPSKPLAPPSRNATKPSPSSQIKPRKGLVEDLNTYTYLSHPSAASDLLLTTAKLTSSLTVAPSQDASNDAIARLQSRLQQSRANDESNGDLGGMRVTAQVIDPELAQRQAEQAEKEAEKMRRRRENQELKEKERGNRAAGRRPGGGLNVASLEDEDELGMSTRRKTNASAAARRKRANKTGEIYSDEDMEDTRGRTREDEYDEEDDFLVGSDEEEEIGEEGEEDIDEQIERAEHAAGRKRATPDDDDDDEEQDAEGEPDDTAPASSEQRADRGSPLARSKRRRIIEDEDEE